MYDDRVTDQCKVWLRLGHLHIATSKFEKAAVSFRNVILLVNESEGALRFKGEAEMGNGKSFHELGKYKVGNDHYMKALTIWMKLNDKSQEIETCKGLVYGYDKVGDVDKAEIYEKRYKSLARHMIHQPLGGASGQATDVEIRANELLRWKKELTEIYEKTTGQPLDKLKADMERDKFMNAEEAVAYGLVDKIVTNRADDDKE